MDNNFDGNQFNQVGNYNGGNNPGGNYNGGINPGGNYNGGNNQGGVGLGVTSMILGILSILFSCCFYYLSVPLSLIGLILGAVAVKNGNRGKGMAVAGLVLSIISLALGIIGFAMGGALLAELGLMDF